MRFAIAFAAVLSLAGCVSAPPPVPQPQPKPAPAPAPPPPAPPAANWQDWPITPGNWVLRQDARGSVALFGQGGADAVFLIRCVTATKQIYLSRAGAFPAGDTGQMTIRASDAVKGYTVTNNGDTPPYVSAETPASDPQLDAIAFSRGRFLVSVKGADDLVIPPWPEFARVIEDCREQDRGTDSGVTATLPK